MKIDLKTLIPVSDKKKILSLLRIIERRLPLFFKKKLPKHINLLFVSPVFSKKLNQIYRDKNKPANVLSFVYDTTYAEIFITPAVLKKEMKKYALSYEKLLAKMIIHGIIHCSGLDHDISEKDARRFDLLEKKLLNSL